MAKQRLEQKQHLNLSPQQIQFLSLLQIPIVELKKRIEQELEGNPTLEESEDEDYDTAYEDYEQYIYGRNYINRYLPC